ncbi:hypothetical protein CFT13S00388_00225 [Campylobacter fetus subsp. testudinum]|uniref:hypothetical protein n=1 Tax=Campylobacter fetus TaxID=196 RepID=UPI0008189863|nr:hypothetical protein [Campylobacter fetus]OCR88683.1 hypothetical protein CFT13S00388_00225 [Campylobacter fetus subsp. testudinum]OCS00579.1 hypothetical protein A9K75_02750 [Campylobacter fetus subsp. testudinum]
MKLFIGILLLVLTLFTAQAKEEKTSTNSSSDLKTTYFSSYHLYSNKNDSALIDSIIFTAITVVFISLIMLIIFLRVEKIKKLKSKNRLKIIQEPFYMEKIHKKFMLSKPQQGDIVERLELFFKILHIKAAKNNNVVVFNYDPKQHRYFSADFKIISYAVHMLNQFVINIISNSSIILTIKNTNITNRIYKVTLKANANILEMDDNIKDALKGKTKNINYKKLVIASNIAKLLGSKLRYQSKSSEFEFSFNLLLTPLQQDNKHKFINEYKNEINALIAEDDINSFHTLTAGLRHYDIKIKPNYTWEIVKKHITDTIFRPELVFIQAKIIKKLSKNDINILKEHKERKNITFIILSNNASYDDVNKVLDFETFTLKQPYTQDALLAVLNRSQQVVMGGGYGEFLGIQNRKNLKLH